MENSLYDIVTDANAIIAGTTNRVRREFTEATKVTTGEKIDKSLAYLKSFAGELDKVVKAAGRDKLLVATAGNITALKNYDTMVKALSQLKEFLGVNNSEVNALSAIHDSLLKYQSIYTDGYKNGVAMVTLEYEAASSALIRGISALIVTQVEPQTDGVGKIRFSKVSKKSGGIFTKMAKDIAKELKSSSHEKYLKNLIDLATDPELKVTPGEVPVTEAAAGDAVTSTASEVINVIRYGWKGLKSAGNIGKLLVKSMFGIIPLIRSMIYLHYKRKVDTVANLELQAQYVELNIQQLENIKTMDEEKKRQIIKKQRAYVDAYRKKAEKLRAQLTETERVAVEEIKAADSEITPDDDYVLD